jgi:hypothetical protein
MKKYLFVMMAGLIFFGGALNAQEEIPEDAVVLTMGDTELPKANGVYLLITDGVGTTEYNVNFYIETSSENPPAIDLCLYGPDGRSGEMLPVTIQGDYVNGTYTVSSCNEENPRLSVDLSILTDTDGDGLVGDDDKCPDSDRNETVAINGCDSLVDNKLFGDGCTISDHIAECATKAANHGEFVSCVTHYTNGLKSSSLTGAEKGAIQSCAAQSSIGILPCSGPGCEEGDSSLAQNRHRARYELAENDLVIPCVEIGRGQYFALDMDLTYATSKNFHFKVKKAEMMDQMQVDEIEAPEECAQYDLGSNSLTFPSLDIAGTQYRVQMKLLGANSVNLHFKLQSIGPAAEP